MKQKTKKKKIQVLNIGCGNSALSEDLWDDGIKNVAGIDFCKKIIDIMNDRKDKYQREDLKYSHMDARGMTFENERFDVVFDKGCIDSMICTKDPKESLNFAFTEVSRVLKKNGYFILFSCGIDEMRTSLVNMRNYNLKLISTNKVKARTGLIADINILLFQKE